MLDPSIQQLLIVGPGLLGGSIGLALREQGFAGKIVGFSRRPATIQTALDRHCIDEATADLPAAAAASDLIVLATPVQTLCKLIQQFAGVDLPGVITDVGSTKRSIVACAERHLKNPANFVGSHPMAGSEQHGPQSADPRLFAGKPVVLTPCDNTNTHAITVVESLWATLGMRVFRMSADEHDHTVARVSHLPHAISVALMLLTGRAPGSSSRGLDIASTGLRDVTRLAGGDADVWAEIFLDNAAAMKDTFAEYESLLNQLHQLIDRGDRAALVRLLNEAGEIRRNWLCGH
ncbi:MAG: prephenate dehydrogenase [Phycisphaeraceae bacterium]